MDDINSVVEKKVDEALVNINEKLKDVVNVYGERILKEVIASVNYNREDLVNEILREEMNKYNSPNNELEKSRILGKMQGLMCCIDDISNKNVELEDIINKIERSEDMPF